MLSNLSLTTRITGDSSSGTVCSSARSSLSHGATPVSLDGQVIKLSVQRTRAGIKTSHQTQDYQTPSFDQQFAHAAANPQEIFVYSIAVTRRFTANPSPSTSKITEFCQRNKNPGQKLAACRAEVVQSWPKPSENNDRGFRMMSLLRLVAESTVPRYDFLKSAVSNRRTACSIANFFAEFFHTIMRKSRFLPASLLFSVMLLCVASTAFAQSTADPLPSWNEGAAKKAIVDFITRTTQSGTDNRDYLAPSLRIATFDNDGTLWCEQPIYAQVMFALDRVKALAPQHPEWKTTEPFQSILADPERAMLKFTIQDFEKVIAVSHSGMTIEDFESLVKKWLATSEHPRFHRRYTDLVYQPMLELMAYLRASGFKTYIVTGGGQEFVRTFAQQVYGVPPEQVIGTAGKTKYEYDKQGKPELVKLPEILLIDDKTGKPEAINLIIGRRPMAAFGNSTGDQQMLEWAQADNHSQIGTGSRLLMLVHHDDAQREYAYGPDSKVGTFTSALMDEAKQRGWTVISMKDDWKTIFPFQK